MPAMPRFSKRGTKIAYKILGKPENIAFKPTARENDIDRRLTFQDTTRVR
jgi:hypothetical protein